MDAVDGDQSLTMVDADIYHRQNDSRRRNVDDIYYCMTGVLLQFFVIELIVDWN